MVPELCRVVAVRRETPDVVTLTLEPSDPDGCWRATPPRPGQFAMVGAIGVGEVPISYSALPAMVEGGSARSVDHTIRAVGAVTEALVAAGVGTYLTNRGPFGIGWDVDAAAGRDVVVVAGGIGLAPLKPVVDTVLAEPDRFGTLHVLVGARTPADVPFTTLLERWRDQGAQVALTVDRLEGPGADGWEGRVGVVTTLIPRAGFDPAAATAFVCGPEVMMRFAVRALIEEGMDQHDVGVSLERSMTCGVGHCGHCQLGPLLICRDGPVVDAAAMGALVAVKAR
jgi:NAD(P)H-flavin reductase